MAQQLLLFIKEHVVTLCYSHYNIINRDVNTCYKQVSLKDGFHQSKCYAFYTTIFLKTGFHKAEYSTRVNFYAF